jgi:hypothetical protein
MTVFVAYVRIIYNEDFHLISTMQYAGFSTRTEVLNTHRHTILAVLIRKLHGKELRLILRQLNEEVYEIGRSNKFIHNFRCEILVE